MAVDIALAGLIFQVITLVAFIVGVFDYMFRSRSVWMSVQLPTRFKVFCAALSLATITITIRCCYRIYELAGGYSRENEGLRDEPLFIALESVMIIVAAYALVVAHPGPIFRQAIVPGADDERATMAEVKSLHSSTSNLPAPTDRV